MIICLVLAASVFTQRPQRREGSPAGGPPRDGGGRPPFGAFGPPRPDGPSKSGWMKPLDENQNGVLEGEELQTAIERTFAELDKDGSGSIEADEAFHQARPQPGAAQEGGDKRPGNDGKRLLPPFFFADNIKGAAGASRSEFEQFVRGVFKELDKNGDGVLSRDEAEKIPESDGPPRPDSPGMPPNAKFIAAELRFGDKLVKGQPFSAETVIEDTRRLFDGTTVTKKSSGAIYRDGDGRTRREQPLEMVGGFSVVGNDNKPKMLVFINDFAAKTQIFLDLNDRIARKSRFEGPVTGPEPGLPNDAKDEYLGLKTFDGITAEGTRTTFNIPIGEIGNDKPIQVVTERWFSPELQVLVMSRHLDPLAGEHVFRLINIRRAEPSAGLFAIPAGFRTESRPGRRPEE